MIHMSTGITADPDLAIPILPFAPSSGSGVYRIMCSSLFLFPPIKDDASASSLFCRRVVLHCIKKCTLFCLHFESACDFECTR